jgi:hypothetical protein
MITSDRAWPLALIENWTSSGPDGDAEPHLASDPYRDFPWVMWRVFAAGRSSTLVRHRVVK